MGNLLSHSRVTPIILNDDGTIKHIPHQFATRQDYEMRIKELNVAVKNTYVSAPIHMIPSLQQVNQFRKEAIRSGSGGYEPETPSPMANTSPGGKTRNRRGSYSLDYALCSNKSFAESKFLQRLCKE